MEEKFFDNPLFEGISRDTLRDLDISIEECRYDSDEILFDEGEPGEHVYLVLEGKIRISKRGRGGRQELLAMEEPGSFFGEMALIDGRERSARATAAEPSVLGRIDRKGFEKFLGHSPETARNFGRLITAMLRDANSQFIEKLLQTERLSLLGTMMSAMVHDFRNPVSTLVMVSDYLTSRTDDPDLVELGRHTEQAVEQMQLMIQELLDFSRGTISIELEAIPLRDLLAKLDKQILKKVEGSGITVLRELEYDGEITCDSQRLLRLLLNVVRNAWESMTRGGTLTLRIRRAGERIEIEIADTGCGIDPEILERVFEPFVTHGKSRGTGLGMAIAKSVVEAHRGSIRMESEVGRGTTCFIELPVCPSV